MIYFLYGTDSDLARHKAHNLIDSMLNKKPDASLFIMNRENWFEGQLKEYTEGMGLFSNKYIVLLDRLCEDKNLKEIIVGYIKMLSESPNIFIILEGKIDKATLTKITKYSEKTQEFVVKEEKKTVAYDAFALANAVGRRDKKQAWVLYREALDRGEAVEALHGMIFWKMKTLYLNDTSSVYSKIELHALLDKLITIYHESRRGVYELETALERLLLEL